MGLLIEAGELWEIGVCRLGTTLNTGRWVGGTYLLFLFFSFGFFFFFVVYYLLRLLSTTTFQCAPMIGLVFAFGTAFFIMYLYGDDFC